MAKTVDCIVPDCPTPKIFVQDIPPILIPKIDIGDLSALSDELVDFFKEKLPLLNSKGIGSLSMEERILLQKHLKDKKKEEFKSIMEKSNLESNDSEGYIVVYCDTGHKNIVDT